MRKKILRKRIKLGIMVMMICATTGMVVNADYVSSISSSILQSGASGSAYYTKATGKSSEDIGYLQAAIKRTGDTGWHWGNADGGNKIYLTATSPVRAGARSAMRKRVDHN